MKSAMGVVLFGLALSAVWVHAADWLTFRKADNDNNGSISMDEAQSVQGLADNFAQYDKDSDGKLSRSEYESAKKAAGTAGGAEQKSQ